MSSWKTWSARQRGCRDKGKRPRAVNMGASPHPPRNDKKDAFCQAGWVGKQRAGRRRRQGKLAPSGSSPPAPHGVGRANCRALSFAGQGQALSPHHSDMPSAQANMQKIKAIGKHHILPPYPLLWFVGVWGAAPWMPIALSAIKKGAKLLLFSYRFPLHRANSASREKAKTNHS